MVPAGELFLLLQAGECWLIPSGKKQCNSIFRCGRPMGAKATVPLSSGPPPGPGGWRSREGRLSPPLPPSSYRGSAQPLHDWRGATRQKEVGEQPDYFLAMCEGAFFYFFIFFLLHICNRKLAYANNCLWNLFFLLKL